MRLLFLFLLLVNGLIYLWHTTEDKPAAAAPPDAAPRLVLLTEAGRTPPPAYASAPATDAESCYTLGPFMNQESLRRGDAALTRAGHRFTRRVSRIKEQIGYWVYLPPFANADAAQQKAGELERLGELHFYIVRPPSEHANAISLGVFEDRANAEKRHRQMQTLGHNATLQPRFRQNPVYWLDYVAPAAAGNFDNSALTGTRVLPRVCG